MTDDIVNMLRKEYDHFNESGVGDYEVITTAADEIERLRKVVLNQMLETSYWHAVALCPICNHEGPCMRHLDERKTRYAPDA